MKNLLLPLFSLVLFSTYAQAADSDSELKKPMLYDVEIHDMSHKILFSTTTNNLSNKPQSKSVDNTYIDNCVKNKDSIESTKSSIPTTFDVSFNEDLGVASSIMVHISKVVDKKKINTGECDIEETVIGSATITQNLPFLSFDYKFHLKDKSGKEFPEIYYLKVSGKKLN